jgi:hypothetical protein
MHFALYLISGVGILIVSMAILNYVSHKNRAANTLRKEP